MSLKCEVGDIIAYANPDPEKGIRSVYRVVDVFPSGFPRQGVRLASVAWAIGNVVTWYETPLYAMRLRRISDLEYADFMLGSAR